MIQRPLIYALLVGFWLAGQQVTMFLALQTHCTATVPAFMAATAGWLAGSLVGVWLPPRLARLGLVSGVAGPLLLRAWLAQSPFQPGLLPAFTLVIAVSALYAGQFFRTEQGSFASPGRLFFWENNGFLLGLAAASVACLFYGSRVGGWWPLLGLALLAVKARKQQEKSAIV